MTTLQKFEYDLMRLEVLHKQTRQEFNSSNLSVLTPTLLTNCQESIQRLEKSKDKFIGFLKSLDSNDFNDFDNMDTEIPFTPDYALETDATQTYCINKQVVEHTAHTPKFLSTLSPYCIGQIVLDVIQHKAGNSNLAFKAGQLLAQY